MRHPAPSSEILAYYERGGETTRLRAGMGLLELERTRDILRRLLPAGPVTVLDVGGGSGVHAEWLAADGHAVHLLDPVATHVDQAAELPGVTATVADARSLPVGDATADAAVLLGPLYHLLDRAERVRALAEARRVVRPGGLVAAATINRLAAVYDMARQGRFTEPGPRAAAAGAAATGELRPVDGMGFTTAYLHRPGEVPGELADAGLTVTGQYHVEGPMWLLPDLDDRMRDPAQRANLLDALRLTESDPSVLGVGGHLITAGRRAAGG